MDRFDEFNRDWTIWTNKIAEETSQYFGLSRSYICQLLNNNFSTVNLEKFEQISNSILPFLKPYVELVDEETKNRVAKVLLSDIDYSKLGEKEAKYRLENLFEEMTKRGINPYKMIYCQVIYDGMADKFSENDLRDFRRNYRAVKSLLNLSDEETNKIFERCSALVARANEKNIYAVKRELGNFIYLNARGDKAYALLSNEEIIEILKINPSLFCAGSEKVASAYRYLMNKVCDQLKMENLDKEEFVIARTKKLRAMIKNNSSLLAINAQTMREKESLILNILGNDFSTDLTQMLATSNKIAQISAMRVADLKANGAKNVQNLLRIMDRDTLYKFLSKNVEFLSVNCASLEHVIDEVDARGQEYIDRFLQVGRKMLVDDKLNANVAVNYITNYAGRFGNLNVKNSSGSEAFEKFTKIFFDDDEIQNEIRSLAIIRAKNIKNGEKILRENIRVVGKNINMLNECLKKNVSLNKISNRVFNLSENLDVIKMQRLALSGKDDIRLAIEVENKTSDNIEKTLNKIRDIYNQKIDGLKEKYDGLEELYAKTMEFLDSAFDDKKSIAILYDENISTAFLDLLLENFATSNDNQLSIFGQTYEVDEKNMPIQIRKIVSEISDSDPNFPQTTIEIPQLPERAIF